MQVLTNKLLGAIQGSLTIGNLKFISIVFLLSACSTTGKLEYYAAKGELKTACETEYSGAPSIDKYAVKYIISYCAQKAAMQGYEIIDKTLLETDLSIPPNPNGIPWSFENATELYKSKQLTDKEYGYIIAYIDLGLKARNK